MAATQLGACIDATSPRPTQLGALAPLASGTGGGVGGGGGGGVGGVRPCAITNFGIVNNRMLSSSVAPYWQPNTTYGAQAIGATEKSCDSIAGAVMVWTDVTGTNVGCDVSTA